MHELFFYVLCNNRIERRTAYMNDTFVVVTYVSAYDYVLRILAVYIKLNR